MRINFFEEFPTRKNLEKVKLINFPSTIFIASKDFEEFDQAREKVKKMNKRIEVAWWPLFEKSYWISPFSYTYELKNLHKILRKNKEKKPLKLLLDLELPMLNKLLLVRNIFKTPYNKRLIKKIFRKAKDFNIEIFTAEFPASGKFVRKRLELLGLSFPNVKQPHKRIIMYYSSMISSKFLRGKVKGFIADLVKDKGKKNIGIGLGTISKGILGNEKLLSVNSLGGDLEFFSKIGIREVTIFRLGGLNKDYLRAIKKYTN